jgi:hypothetical protein
MTPQNTKKEGGSAASGRASLFGKKARPQSTLSEQEPIHITNPGAVIDALEKVPSILEKKSPEEAIGLGITYREEAAAERLWIRLEDMTALRKGILTVGKDYVRKCPDGIVRITAGGLARLKAILEQGSTLVVLSGHVVNPNLVLARVPGKEEVQRVRVADNKEWCKGMVMTGCVPAETAKFWSCNVRPRFKGRA